MATPHCGIKPKEGCVWLSAQAPPPNKLHLQPRTVHARRIRVPSFFFLSYTLPLVTLKQGHKGPRPLLPFPEIILQWMVLHHLI